MRSNVIEKMYKAIKISEDVQPQEKSFQTERGRANKKTNCLIIVMT